MEGGKIVLDFFAQRHCAELCHRLQWQWNLRVAAVGHRKDFGGLDFGPTRTRTKLATLGEEQTFLPKVPRCTFTVEQQWGVQMVWPE
jgi:hypothetical protein